MLCIETRSQSGATAKTTSAPEREMHLNNFSAEVSFCPACVLFYLISKARQLSRHLQWHSSTRLPLCQSRNHSQMETLVPRQKWRAACMLISTGGAPAEIAFS